MGDPGFGELCQRKLAYRRFLQHARPILDRSCDYLITMHGEDVAADLFRDRP